MQTSDGGEDIDRAARSVGARADPQILAATTPLRKRRVAVSVWGEEEEEEEKDTEFTEDTEGTEDTEDCNGTVQTGLIGEE
ncbi:MAG: hypothetical protein HYV19_14070 [Gemmatimonadetes bacterium]|nr:hypothetical protein [Gemmatimonadota bacterium]